VKIYGRRYLKSIALMVHRPLRPVLQALGVDAKSLYEFAYRRSRQIEEGTLENRWYQEMFTSRLNLTPEFYAGKRILDIGSGHRGSLEGADMAAERVCLDPLVPRYRALGIDKHKARYVDAPAERIPFPEGHFDVVSSIDALDHVVDVGQAIREMIRVLAPSGMILLIVEIHPRPIIAEPHALPWALTKRSGGLQVSKELHLAKPADGTGYFGAHLPFDHARAAAESSYLIAKLANPLGPRPPEGPGARPG
jgi:SAM-dependent methyltransferase